jgi:membrane-bound lytic murein transglycosylase MltF
MNGSDNEPMTKLSKGLFTFASYNAGPGRIAQLRKEAAKRGLDPNIWSDNVEVVASEKIGRETVHYVSNIYKYYLACKMIEEERAERERGAAPASFFRRREGPASEHYKVFLSLAGRTSQILKFW